MSDNKTTNIYYEGLHPAAIVAIVLGLVVVIAVAIGGITIATINSNQEQTIQKQSCIEHGGTVVIGNTGGAGGAIQCIGGDK